MNIIELKKHIKLYEIYLKINKIKELLIEKYEQYNKKLDFDKSRISKQTSTSVTKSTSSIKIKKFILQVEKIKCQLILKEIVLKPFYIIQIPNFSTLIKINWLLKMRNI